MVRFRFKTVTALIGGVAMFATSSQATAMQVQRAGPTPIRASASPITPKNASLKPVANQASEASGFVRRPNPVNVNFDDAKVPGVLPNNATARPPQRDTPVALTPIAARALKNQTPTRVAQQPNPATRIPGQNPVQNLGTRQNISMQQQMIQSTELITRTSNLVTTEIKSPKFVNVGQSAPVVITLRNLGRNAVENVVFTATLPAHTELESASPQPTSTEGQTLEFVVSRIGAEDIRKIILNLVPNEKLPMDVSTQVRVENIQRTLVAVRQPLLSLTINGPQQTNIGQTVVHSLVVANIGDGVATDVHLDVEFPEQLQMMKQSIQSAIRRIDPGKSVTVNFESTAQVAGSVELKVAANSKGAESQETLMMFDIMQPELRVSAAGPKRNFVDRDGVYTITVENTGEVDVNDVQVALAIPTGLKVNTISREATVDAEKGVLYWTFNSIAAKSVEKIQLKAMATLEGSQVYSIVVSSTETGEREVQLATQVVTRADLNVRITNQSGPVPVGGKVEFLVEVENQGTRRAGGVNVRVVLPDSLVSADGDQEFVEQKENTLLFVEPQVVPGQKVTFKFTAIAKKQGEHVVRSSTETETSEHQLISEDIVFVYEVDEARVSEKLIHEVKRR